LCWKKSSMNQMAKNESNLFCKYNRNMET
jgi:hypothetical protein